MNLLDVQKLIYENIKQLEYKYNEKYPVLDDYSLYQEANPPYVILSDLVVVENDTKTTEGMVVQQYIHLYSTYQGKKEILDMIQKVSEVMNFSTDSVYTKQGKTTIMGETSNQGLFVSDRKYDKFYHAVMIFKIYIY